MGKIFYADKSAFTTEATLKKIFSTYCGKCDVSVLRTKNGKPYVEDGPYFSVTHSNDRLYIAFSDKEIGLDAENLSRTPHYPPIVKKFPPDEQAEITCTTDFLKHWVVKESAVKYLGGTLANDLKHLQYANGYLTHNEQPFPAKITLLQHKGYILSVCCNDTFENAEFIPLETL
ncbi:MAG: 4'-phosphopantetheinyl transferase superfamily protein [Clostridia bacterium]|nr:4'-phosphopantetheinyl transferase superfamily protein [Clostridia bacterium]